MKLFLTKLSSCWQSPQRHSSNSESGFDQSENAPMNPHPKRRSSSAHWRPVLTAISEDNSVTPFVVSSSGSGDVVGRRKIIKDQGPRSRKAMRARVKPSGYSSDLDSSWKVQAQIAIPAFSPAPFMF